MKNWNAGGRTMYSFDIQNEQRAGVRLALVKMAPTKENCLLSKQYAMRATRE